MRGASELSFFLLHLLTSLDSAPIQSESYQTRTALNALASGDDGQPLEQRNLDESDTVAARSTVNAEHAEGDAADRVASYWAEQQARLFVSGEVSLGVVNRLSAAVGYGRPHYLWAGVEAGAVTTFEFGAIYASLRLVLLAVNADLGVRATHSYKRTYPELQERYDDAALTASSSQLQSTLSLDARLEGYVPLGPVLGFWNVTHERVLNQPETRALFLEYMRYTVDAPHATMLRSAWFARLYDDRLFVGPAVDAVVSEGRGVLVRAGAALHLRLSPHLSLAGILTVPLVTPDAIDWFTQSWGFFRIQYAFATGERGPLFP